MAKRGIYIILSVFVILMCFIFLTSQTTSYDLDQKFGISGKVVDSGTYLTKAEIIEKIEAEYLSSLEKNEKFYFVFGNSDEVQLINYEDLAKGSISFMTGNSYMELEIIENKYKSKKLIPIDDKVEVVVNNKNYEFKLKEGENIYFIIKDE